MIKARIFSLGTIPVAFWHFPPVDGIIAKRSSIDLFGEDFTEKLNWSKFLVAKLDKNQLAQEDFGCKMTKRMMNLVAQLVF